MMDFNDFCKKTVIEMGRRNVTGSVQITNVVKNNQTKYTGMVISDGKSNISPTLYLEKYYKKFIDGESFDEVENNIWKDYLNAKPKSSMDISGFVEWGQAKNSVFLKVINYEKNKEELVNMPHRRFWDLAVVYYYVFSFDKNGLANTVVRNEHMKIWNVSEEELFFEACDNYKKQLPVTIRNIEDVLMTILNENTQEKCDNQIKESMPIFIASNVASVFGATVILFPEELKPLADKYKSDLIILPSSIHEILLLPDDADDMKLNDYLKMVSEVNQSQLRSEEILSYSVYRYKWKEEKIECVLESVGNK